MWQVQNDLVLGIKKAVTVCTKRLNISECDAAVDFINGESHPNNESLQLEDGYCENFELKRTR